MTGEETHFARPTVAIEIPVDPTVPSKILHPVWGTSSPDSSASSMTDDRDICDEHADQHRFDLAQSLRTFERDSIFD
jgi:hypothetical protein